MTRAATDTVVQVMLMAMSQRRDTGARQLAVPWTHQIERRLRSRFSVKRRDGSRQEVEQIA